jgi:hypothetical protein
MQCINPGVIQSCENGSCACLVVNCPLADGGAGCADITSDLVNCGGCVYATPPAGQTCGTGQACVNSQCVCANGYTSCPIGDGGNYCANTTNDKENCGGCGMVCPHDQKCEQPTPGAPGVCVCDLTEPDGGDLIPCASGCVHSNTDPRNCGMCNILCDTGICNAGVCACDPDGGILQCTPTTCANVNTDVKNCGSCGNDCTQGGTLVPPAFPDIVCQNGSCLCQGGQRDICATDAGPFPQFACIDTTQDPINCGGCGLLPDGGGPFPDGGLPPSPHICTGVKSACLGGNCDCPNAGVYCGPFTWTATDAGQNTDGGICLNPSSDPFNCGQCGNICNNTWAQAAVCQYSQCVCGPDAGVCVVTDDPLNPSCSCNGFPSSSPPNPTCNNIPTLTYSHDIFPLFSSTYVGDAGWGTLWGCATSGCHSPPAAAAGIDFTDPDASYQILAGGHTNTQNCPGNPTATIINPSSICLCQSLVVATSGAYTTQGGSLLYGLVSDQIFNCPLPVGGTVNPMPVDDGGHPVPLSPCLQTQIRQWIDQGAVY